MSKIYQKTHPAGENAGFTLIELLVVVLIIGILAAVALPQYQKAVAKSRFTQLMTAGKSLKDTMEVYYMANGEYPKRWNQLDISYSGCEEASANRYMLWCDKFAVDMYMSENKNLVFYDTHGLEDVTSMTSTELDDKAVSVYTLWLDNSANPGKVTCKSKIDGLCKSMGYE